MLEGVLGGGNLMGKDSPLIIDGFMLLQIEKKLNSSQSYGPIKFSEISNIMSFLQILT